MHLFWFYTIKNDRTTQYIPLRADLLILYLECSLDPGPDLRHEAQLAGEYLGEEDGDHLLARPLTLLLKTSDVDPDPVGSHRGRIYTDLYIETPDFYTHLRKRTIF